MIREKIIALIFLREIVFCLGLVLITTPFIVRAQSPSRQVSVDPFTPIQKPVTNPELEELLNQAERLFIARQPIDARAKLQKALKIAPDDFRPQMLLGIYYLSEVGHFQLAYKYLMNAQNLFEKEYGSDIDGTLDRSMWRINARIISLIAETRLNLDDYQGALITLDRFARSYWDSWYPGTKAWVLMKLKRVDEAIQVAQAGLLQDAEPGKTYNILGILFSLKGNHELALRALAQAIDSENKLLSLGQVSTPLNNAGEIYRETFRDRLAEACWKKALSYPEGCDHILTSLNLAILQVDELRLLQAERTLADFEACYANNPVRSDTEHRALLALGQGKIALRQGDVEKAIKLTSQAAERQQWFGKIGTNQNDVQFAAMITMAQALRAKATILRTTWAKSFIEAIYNHSEAPWLEFRAWWLEKQARQFALDELDDFEDLYIRHTDAMLEYPTLGSLLKGFPSSTVERRLERLINGDIRSQAANYYKLYLAINLYHHGETEQAEKLLKEIQLQFRVFDRLARAEVLSYLIKIKQDNFSIWKDNSKDKQELTKLINELFDLAPSSLHYNNFPLMVRLSLFGNGKIAEKVFKKLGQKLTKHFEQLSNEAQELQYGLSISVSNSDLGRSMISLSLQDLRKNILIASASATYLGEDSLVKLYNNFISRVFSHRVDPSSEPLPQLTILKGNT